MGLLEDFEAGEENNWISASQIKTLYLLKRLGAVNKIISGGTSWETAKDSCQVVHYWMIFYIRASNS